MTPFRRKVAEVEFGTDPVRRGKLFAHQDGSAKLVIEGPLDELAERWQDIFVNPQPKEGQVPLTPTRSEINLPNNNNTTGGTR